MAQQQIHIDIVSAQSAIFSGEAQMVFATGQLGEMGILPGHTPLLTNLKPGQIRVVLSDGEEEVFYVSGGVLEVQPNKVSVLSDTALRALDIDEAAAEQARQDAEMAMQQRGSEFDYSKAATELARAVAQIRAVKQIRHKYGK